MTEAVLHVVCCESSTSNMYLNQKNLGRKIVGKNLFSQKMINLQRVKPT